jgi:hypothetical protein
MVTKNSRVDTLRRAILGLGVIAIDARTKPILADAYDDANGDVALAWVTTGNVIRALPAERCNRLRQVEVAIVWNLNVGGARRHLTEFQHAYPNAWTKQSDLEGYRYRREPAVEFWELKKERLADARSKTSIRVQANRRQQVRGENHAYVELNEQLTQSLAALERQPLRWVVDTAGQIVDSADLPLMDANTLMKHLTDEGEVREVPLAAALMRHGWALGSEETRAIWVDLFAEILAGWQRMPEAALRRQQAADRVDELSEAPASSDRRRYHV